MGTYRQSRNIEASVVDALVSWLSTSWSNVTVVETLKDSDKPSRPVIVVRLQSTSYDSVEIGSFSSMRRSTVYLDFYCTSDGQRLDLKDFIISKIKSGIPYKTMVITNGVAAKTSAGTAHVRILSDLSIDSDIDKSSLPDYEKYRHLISFEMILPALEA